MIEPYLGEFLISPIPLELSFNYCSAACRFCFANLGKPDRTVSIPSITNLLRDYLTRQTLTAQLLRDGHAVLISNKVDPFAHSNFQQAVPIMRTMTELGIPIALQTRGGRGVDEVLSFLPSSVWYISINTASEDFRKQLEPGATTMESRFQLMETLKEKGHRVVLGLNPLVPEWVPDAEPILKRAKASGAEGVWLEGLHLNPKQIANMSPQDKAIMTPAIIARALKRICPPVCSMALEKARRQARDLGLEVFSKGQPFASDFFRPWRETYQKTFPVLQDLVNHCFAAHPDTLSFDEVTRILRWETLPAGQYDLSRYIGAVAHGVVREKPFHAKATFYDLLQYAWEEPRIKFCPARMRCFAYAAAEVDGKQWEGWTDDQDRVFLAFIEQGWKDYVIEIPPVKKEGR